jgi:hypothetical protein
MQSSNLDAIRHSSNAGYFVMTGAIAMLLV